MKSCTIVAALAIASGLAVAGPFDEYNLIVRNDLNLSTSEVDGSAIIGGSLLGGTSNYTTMGVTASNGDGLAIGNTLASGVTVNINNAGNFRIGSLANQLGTVNLNGGGSLVADPLVSSRAASYVSQASAISAHLSTLATNGTIDVAGNMTAATTVLDGMNVAVYTLSQAQFDTLGQLSLNFGTADSVIINFVHDGSGVVDLSAPPNIIGGFNQANSPRILWNFADATQITVNNSFNGALFAPLAQLNVTGGGINGTVVVDSINLQNAEIRLGTYQGYLPTPGAGALLAAAGLLASRRRRAA
ncbi:MAG: collagen-binding domain-containing protein [Phycisphaerales bacterium]